MKLVYCSFLLLLGVLHAGAAPDEEVSAGAPMPDLTFRTVLGGDGRTKLSELRGQPVIIAWYSTVFAGLEAARATIGLEKKHGKDGLAVFLMEIKNHDTTYLRALQMKELNGATCPLLKNQKLHVTYDESTGLPPNMVLIGVDGTLLYAGSYQSLSEVSKLLKKEIKKRADGWGEVPLAEQTRALAYAKGKLGEAWALLQEGTDDAAGDKLGEVAAEITTRFETWKRSVGFLVEQGEPQRALETARGLVAASVGNPAWSAAAQELLVSFDTPEMKRELELAKKLDVLLKPLKSKSPRKGIDVKLSRFADEAKGTKVSARAAQLADAAALALGKLDE